MRVASGAVVCGMREARGSHGVRVVSGEGLEGALLEDRSESRACFSGRVRVDCFKGLRVRRISVSRSRTSRFSVRRSVNIAPAAAADDLARVCDEVPRRSLSSAWVPEGTRGRDVDALAARLSAEESDFMCAGLREVMSARALHRGPGGARRGLPSRAAVGRWAVGLVHVDCRPRDPHFLTTRLKRAPEPHAHDASCATPCRSQWNSSALKSSRNGSRQTVRVGTSLGMY
jgi:hypothetical protein